MLLQVFFHVICPPPSGATVLQHGLRYHTVYIHQNVLHIPYYLTSKYNLCCYHLCRRTCAERFAIACLHPRHTLPKFRPPYQACVEQIARKLPPSVDQGSVIRRSGTGRCGEEERNQQGKHNGQPPGRKQSLSRLSSLMGRVLFHLR